MLIAQIFLLILIAALSFYGGLWLWKGISTNDQFSTKAILSAAIFLFLLCSGVSTIIFHHVYINKDNDSDSSYFILFLSISLCYNGGYLCSIRFREQLSGKKLLKPEFLMAPVFSAMLCMVAGEIYQPDLYPIAFILGLIVFFMGFFIWEHLKKAEIFSQEAFMRTLWRLSVGFVIISFIIVILGIASFYVEGLNSILLYSILAIIISLSRYCLGLIYSVLVSHS